MKIREYMSNFVITIKKANRCAGRACIMRMQRIRRLPVVDDSNHLIGIVSERISLYASPSPATSLSVWELNYLLAALEVGQPDVATSFRQHLMQHYRARPG